MAKGKFINKVPQRRVLKLEYSHTFEIHLQTVQAYGESAFGSRVVKEFYRDLMAKIIILPKTPNIYARSRFIESTERKIYRNIVFRSYLVIYSVTSSTVRIIDIVHQSTNPDTIAEIN